MKHRATRVHIRRPHQQRMQAGLDGGCAIAQCRSEWRQEGGREVCLRGRPVSESLEDDLLRLGVAELGQVGQACELDHRRRATHEYEALLLWAGQPLRDHGVGDETGGELPAGGRSVERVPHLEARGVLGRIPVEHLAHEDIVLGLVGVQHRDLGRVAGVVQDSSGDLQHRGDPSASSDHAKLLACELLGAALEDASAQVLVHAPRSRHSDGLALRHAGHVLRHLAAVHEVLVDAALVGLEHELDLAEVPVARHRRVHPVDLSLVRRHVLPPIPLASHLADDVRSEDLEVLAGGQAEHGRGLGQREGEVQRVVRYVLLLRQRQLLPLLVEELLLSSASHEEHCEQQHGEADDHRHHRHRHQRVGAHGS
mmetsp:Transcript_19898/g.47095  ORF Transcript_19898/g.47095 Transcript_19898/m.47095 type:complete len:368 (+) Transcript_19898:38-1141(+)